MGEAGAYAPPDDPRPPLASLGPPRWSPPPAPPWKLPQGVGPEISLADYAVQDMVESVRRALIDRCASAGPPYSTFMVA